MVAKPRRFKCLKRGDSTRQTALCFNQAARSSHRPRRIHAMALRIATPRSTWLLLAAALLACAAPVRAADDPAPPVRRATDPLATARALIKDQRWADAIAALRQVNNTGNADWNNLMGYTHRKSSPPDLAAAEKYYDAALKLDPRHRGALEYSGELYLMLGDLPRAEARLTQLDQVCASGCEEQKDLRAAVVAYKANGGKPISQAR
jgi:tetratricopeptide (TPR) repeat protein